MRFRLSLFPLNAVLLLMLTTDVAVGEVRLPNVLESHMVLQRDAPVRVWGWAESGESITVTLGDAAQGAIADGDGTRQVELPAQSADGEKRTICVEGSNTIELTDLLVGDV